MYFEAMVDQLRAEFDVTQARAVAVVNERLDELLARSEGLTYRKSLGTTTAGTSTYTLDADVVRLKRIRVDYTDGVTLFEGASPDFLDDLDAELATYSGRKGLFAIVPDDDADSNTSDVRLYPTPEESSVTILGVFAGLGSDLTYSASTALPVPEDMHEGLLAGARAELMRTEEGVSDAAAEQGFQEAIAALKKRSNARGTGTGPRRVAMWGYDWA